jgi:dTDP-4-dehydrorhamnose reductase
MNVLVFGKDGQLGKAFRSLFDETTAGFSLQPNIQYIGRTECDSSNPDAVNAVLNEFKPDLIINASAYTAVDKAESEVKLAYAINAKAPELMALFAVKNNSTFLHYSTDYVFDGEKYGFYLEDDVRNPLGVYGKSKAAGEEAIAKVFAASSGGQFAIFRTSWVYGDGGNFIRTILRLAKEREELKIIADQYGVPTSAEWLAKLSIHLAVNKQGGLKIFPSGIYHAVPSGETTWHGLATVAVIVALEAGATLKAGPGAIKAIAATEYPLPVPRPMNSRMSTDKLRSVLAKSGSYNDSIENPGFLHWEEMVRDYIRQLAASKLI